jgi:hypothetical protein
MSEEIIEIITPTEETQPTQNEINLTKHHSIHLVNFEIKSIRILPYQSASIDIVINTDGVQLFRTVNLSGDDYAGWSSDDGYLYEYIKKNIETIYGV